MSKFYDANKEEIDFMDDLKAFLIRHKIELDSFDDVAYFNNNAPTRDGEIYLSLEEVKEYYDDQSK